MDTAFLGNPTPQYFAVQDRSRMYLQLGYYWNFFFSWHYIVSSIQTFGWIVMKYPGWVCLIWIILVSRLVGVSIDAQMVLLEFPQDAYKPTTFEVMVHEHGSQCEGATLWLDDSWGASAIDIFARWTSTWLDECGHECSHECPNHLILGEQHYHPRLGEYDYLIIIYLI